MLEGQGFPARAHHLAGVAAASMLWPSLQAPRRIRRVLPRASRRSLAGVDAICNRRPGLHTPGISGSAWAQNFNNGNQNNNNKDWSARVRAVRK